MGWSIWVGFVAALRSWRVGGGGQHSLEGRPVFTSEYCPGTQFTIELTAPGGANHIWSGGGPHYVLTLAIY